MSSPWARTQASAIWPGCRVVRCRDGGDLVDERAVGVEGVVGEPWLPTTEVGGRQLRGAGDGARQHASAERAVGDDADAELAAGVQDVTFDVAAEQRVLGLERGDRVHRDGPPDRVGGGFGQPEVAHLAGGDELGHRADGLLDGHVGIGPVQVVQVDVVEAEPGERAVDRGPDVLGAAVDLAYAGLDRAGRRMPNFVATTASSRRDAIAFPTTCSLTCGP